MEQPREWDLIQYGNSVVRRAVRLLRDDSNDESAVRVPVDKFRGCVGQLAALTVFSGAWINKTWSNDWSK